MQPSVSSRALLFCKSYSITLITPYLSMYVVGVAIPSSFLWLDSFPFLSHCAVIAVLKIAKISWAG
ncbi:hypothetical protein K445DRAFT_315296 [Daldinia sp. EC12]|nr:hypothetical protein K445DRAFT_315296 [Daldinia sp. EC12]